MKLGRYETLEELGRGGMGVVHRARDTELGRDVALKVLESTDPEEIRRFQREAQSAARLRHPNIVAIHDVGVDGPTRFFTMDLIEGGTLEGRRLPVRRALEVIRDVARAVHYAHEQGIVHRDIKPGNIMLSRDGTPLVMDFGLAREVDTKSRYTLSGTILGTPSFMSPEQARGEISKIDRRSDVYSLCAVLYEQATGAPPHRSESTFDLIRLVGTKEVTSPSRAGATIGRDIETVIMKGLDLDPSRRYATAAALADDLDRALRNEPILARPLAWPIRAGRWLRRRPLAIGVTALLVVAAGVGLYASKVRGREGALIDQAEKRRQAQAYLDRADQALKSAWGVLRTPGTEIGRARTSAAVAVVEARGALALAPDLVEAHVLEGDAHALVFWLHREERDFAESERAYRRGLEADPDHARVLLGLAELKLMRFTVRSPHRATWTEYGVKVSGIRVKRPDDEREGREVRELFERAVARLSSTGGVEALYARAGLEYARGRYEECIAAAQEAVDKGCPRAEMLYWWMGLSHHYLGRPDPAAAVLQTAVGLLPNMPPIRLSLAFSLMDAGKLDDALKEFDVLFNFMPEYMASRIGRAMTLRRRGIRDRRPDDFREAEKDLTGVILIEESVPAGGDSSVLVEALCNRGLIRIQLGRPVDARQDLMKALALQPLHIPSLLNLGIVEGLEGKYAEAAGHYREVLRIQPDSAVAMSNLGSALHELGETEEALRLLNEALKLDEKLGKTHWIRGRVHLKLKNLSEAEADFNRALELDKTIAPAYADRADFKYRRGDLKGALEDLDRAVLWGFRSSLVHSRRAALRAMLWHEAGRPADTREGVFAACEEDLRTALQINPDNAHAHETLGLFQFDREKFADAVKSFERAIELDPSTRGRVSAKLEEARRRMN